MAMPRPSGKAYKIAEKVIPHFLRGKKTSVKKTALVPNDKMELEITDINENRGRKK